MSMYEHAQPVIILFSAKDRERLVEYAKKMLTFLQANKTIDLLDVAYTLQVGRMAMEERLGMIVSSIEELEDKLCKFVNGQKEIENVFTGLAKEKKSTVSRSEEIEGLINQQQFAKLAELWTNGLHIEWKKLYQKKTPHRVNLPTYPFAKERCWVESNEDLVSELQPLSPEPFEERMSTYTQNEPKIAKDFSAEPVDLTKRMAAYLKNLLGAALKTSPYTIEEAQPLDKYGLNSLLIIEITQKMEQIFGPLSKTLMFEYQTILALSEYFLEHYPLQVQEILQEPKLTTSIPVRSSEHTTERSGQSISPEKKLKLPAPATGALDIAIIGISGCYPQSPDLKAFWQNLAQGKDCITEVPPSRWDWHKFYSAERSLKGTHYSKWGGFIDDVDQFDPLFFNISPKEAIFLDPQERLFLEHAWHALEDSGYCPQDLGVSSERLVGVYAGVMWSEYQLYGPEQDISLGNSYASIANRVSYILNLHGPSIALDTMCSSSLTTLHLACEDLKSGRTDLGIAGGVNVSIHPNKYLQLSTNQFISSDGHCQSFGIGGDGYIPGEGVGVVILKRLEEAIRDQDHIYAVVKGTSINHGGKTSGFTVPNPNAQSIVIRQALQQAQIDPKTVSYIEAHGTGTKLGDPIEIAGLTKAFKNRDNESFCWLGSAKSNIGHCESAAGIAGLTKVVLQIEHQEIVPSLHSEVLNPNIDFEKTPFRVNHELREWKRPIIDGKEFPRIAGISSFGAGGSNAHAIIQEYVPTSEKIKVACTPCLVILSAKNQKVLLNYAKKLLDFINETPDLDLTDLSYTLQVGRVAMEERLGIMTNSIEELQGKLRLFIEGGGDTEIEKVYHGQVKEYRDITSKFEASDELQETIDRLIDHGKFADLLELWVKGFNIHWKKIYGDKRPNRISAPTYPFAKERYWVTKIKSDGSSGSPIAEPIAPLLIPLTSPELQEDILFSTTTQKPTIIQLKNSFGEMLADTTRSFTPESKTTSKEPPASTQQIDITKNVLKLELKAILAKILLMDPSVIDDKTPFIDIGVDSIIGVEWAKEVSKRYGYQISATKLYDYPTIQSFANFLEKETKGAILQESIKTDVLSPNISKPTSAVLASIPLKRIHEIEEQSLEVRPEKQECIAIIGIAGRYPDAPNLNTFWRNLKEGKNAIKEVPRDRWDVNDYYNSDPREAKNGKIYCKWLGALEDIDSFDPLFFMISNAEAEMMDPQHRLFLEEGYHAFEDAGYNNQSLNDKKCGVYLGIMGNEYGSMLFRNQIASSVTSNSSAIGVARLPYFLNLKGPAIPIDTACSSSLVATHLAVQALLEGEIDMALVGGVSLYLTPESFIGMCSAGMLSPEGQCKAFDESANGFVPGEGVGALVLKRLKDAERDNDIIYGVIIGSGINQDGKTNGITAPSANSQMELEREVYRKYSINPESINYVEMHGTGTQLGDPIELDALSTVFKEYTNHKQYVAITSVKSNIGHTSAAAGVASIHKVLLSLKHKQIPKTLNYEHPNSHFNFDDSPFFVNNELKAWGRIADQPRRAAISSFGYSGTNAHIIIEEYIPKYKPPIITSNAPSGAVFVLSAKNKERLVDYAQRILDFVNQSEDINLNNLTYTLQVGRGFMDERLGLMIKSIDELKDKLQAFIHGEQNIDCCFTGQVKQNKQLIASLESDLHFQAQISDWITHKQFSKLLEYWAKGLDFDWGKIYENTIPSRVSLPTYPFASERCWIESSNPISLSVRTMSQLHPLLQENCSTLSEIEFKSQFNGQEFFLKDHIVKGRRILPGAAYLEMAFAAIKYAIKDLPEPIELRNVIWASPLIVEEKPLSAHIIISTEDNFIDYEVYTQNGEDAIVHFTGQALFPHGNTQVSLDLTELKRVTPIRTITPQQCYEIFEKVGLHYGPGFQSIEYLKILDKGVLAKLKLSSSLDSTLNSYTLHPSLLDGALQSSIGLVLQEAITTPLIPFALDSIIIYTPFVSSMWAWIRRTEAIGPQAQKLDIDLCNDAGLICASLTGLLLRPMEEKRDTISTLLLHPVWKEREAEIRENTNIDCWVMEFDAALSIEEQALRLFRDARGIIQENPEDNQLMQVIIHDPLQFCLSGLLKTMHLENPKMFGQVLLIEKGQDKQAVLKDNRQSFEDAEVKYVQGKRYVRTWEEFKDNHSTTLPWEDAGVYLITGGAGGLGLIFAHEIVSKVKAAKIILIGRSALNDDIEKRLASLHLGGCKIDYQQVDVSQKEAVRGLVDGILKQYGVLNGILHAAGVIRDNYLLPKTEDEFRQVLMPKVWGTVYLDEATKDLPLDFFIFFSSIAGAFGNAGQADYAIGNCFMDAYAQWRQDQVKEKKRQGRSLSLNWPLWKEGGMHINAATETLLKNTMGMIPLDTQTGLQAFLQAWSSGYSQTLVVEGVISKLRKKLLDKPVVSKVVQLIDSSELAIHIQKGLQEQVSKLLKLHVEDVDIDSPLSEYGFDSITLTDFANQLNSKYEIDLTPAIFFEHTTIESLAAFLSQQYASKLASHYSLSTVSVETDKQTEEQPRVERLQRKPARNWRCEELFHEPIAIIGMSGAFPMAHNLEEFWQNLLEGKDCISEIPADRWDWRALWGDPNQEDNKTNIKWGGFLDTVAEFDPLFFGISPREALLMDPQQRLLMEHVWLAIEDAGYAPETLSGSKTGIFIATANSGYTSQLEKAQVPVEGYTATGGVPSVGPNRMSYFLNLHGPSEPIETACSSSLVAIHRAVNAMQIGGCEQAIVGGVNTIVDPEIQISFNKAGMLSEDGHCKTFSKNANGYVRGEGVGMLFLKKLSAAEKDGDRIYALIRGSAENHGGKANSLTAPNPKAQAELLIEVYKKSGVDPHAVSYIEAHGTGTELGDPVEVNGLKAAFSELIGKEHLQAPYCGLGTVKSNIGHLELAAGIAGVIKVLLQMQHKTLVKTLYSEEQNPYIDLEGTPFYIVRETRPWMADTPRIAGISSFGFGGANAHVVIEEYVSKQRQEQYGDHPVVIILSAKNKECLHAYAKNLLALLNKQTQINLTDLAYTLQVGRSAMEERLGFIVDNLDALKNKLAAYVNGPEVGEGIYYGQAKSQKEMITSFERDVEFQEMVEKWIQHKKYVRLIEYWVKGGYIDWIRLYPNRKPHRISLPTYPFLKEKYWFEQNKRGLDLIAVQRSGHPFLIHKIETPVYEGIIYEGIVRADWPEFVPEHKIYGIPVIAAAVTISAITSASPLFVKENKVQIDQMEFPRPILVPSENELKIQTIIGPDNEGAREFRVLSCPSKEESVDNWITHVTGILKTKHLDEIHGFEVIEEIKSRCNQTFSQAEAYLFAANQLKIDLGPHYQWIEQMWVGENELIAKLYISKGSEAEKGYVLYPGLIDSFIHAVGVRFLADPGIDKTLGIPLSIDRFAYEITSERPSWVYIKILKESSELTVCTSSLLNDHGKILGQIRNLAMKKAKQEALLKLMQTEMSTTSVLPIQTEKEESLLKLRLIWKEKAVTGAKQNIETRKFELNINQSFEMQAVGLFKEIKLLLESHPQNRLLLQIIISDSLYFGLSGLLKTAHLENPNFFGQLLLLERAEDQEALLIENQAAIHDVEVKYEGGKRYVQSWEEL